MTLFNVENSVVKPTVEVLVIQPYAEIWERDSSDHKERAMKEFAYIEFMSSPKKTNPFSGYSETDREKKIIENLFKGAGYSPDPLVMEGIRQYKEFFDNASPSLAFLKSAKIGAEKVQNFLETVDLTEKTERGMPMYKPKEVSATLTDTFNIMKTLNSLEEKVNQEIYESTKTKANKEINHFER